jgi:hypothetical protein
MRCWRQKAAAGQTVHHSDHGTQYTSWAFGQRLRQARLLGSMGTVVDALDNAVVEVASCPCPFHSCGDWGMSPRHRLKRETHLQ